MIFERFPTNTNYIHYHFLGFGNQ